MQKRLSDRFLPEIKRILGEYLIAEPPVEEDAERNTDLTVLRLDAIRIACRVRSHEYMKYRDQFTIRNRVASGSKTELTKIIEGWGDYFFYGISNTEETNLSHWILGDIKALRLHISKLLYKRQLPWIAERHNHDGMSSFVVFRYNDIGGFLLASSKDREAIHA